MLEFREITLEDRDWINQLLAISDFRGCEYSFANNLAWRRWHNTTICRYDDFYICKAEDTDGLFFTMPAGKGDYRALLEQLHAYAAAKQAPLVLTGVTASVRDLLTELFPGRFSVTLTEDSSDYVYRAEDLRTLAGRKYHQKRNHLKRFQAYPYTFAPLTAADFDDCVTLAANSYTDKIGLDDKSGQVEQFAIHTFFTYFSPLELSGGVLRVNGELVAFTIGEQINSDTLCVHIEKANTEYAGAYAAINYEYINYAAGTLPYVNREEDMGVEGLRKAKRSYHPAFLLEKYTLTEIE